MNTIKITPLYLIMSMIILISTSYAKNIVLLNDAASPQAKKLSTTKTSTIKNGLYISMKYASAIAASFISHYALEYMATYAHEHGHGIASNTHYSVTMNQNSNIFQPWQGSTYYSPSSNQSSEFITTLGGPLTGIFTAYLQYYALKTVQHYTQKKSHNQTQHSIRTNNPFYYFAESIKNGKEWCATTLKKKTIKQLKKSTWLSITLNCILFLRMGRIVGESIYGLMPYHLTELGFKGDGERLWEIILGNNCPKINGDLPTITITILCIPFAIGALQALYEKDTTNNDNAKITTTESTNEKRPS